MKMKTQRQIAFILAALLLFLMLIPGCAYEEIHSGLPPATYEGYVTLRVLLANETTVLFDSVLWDIIQEFEKDHPNVEVEVQRLKEYKENFNSWEELQAEVKSGNGPDIFILNTDDFPGKDTDMLLFPDVNKAMREGQFANLSMYYDYDSELNTAGLRQEVMDVGVVDGFRYTLPLTYDYPVMFVDQDKLKEAGLDEDIFNGGVISVMDAIVELGDQTIAQSASFYEQRYLFNFFPELVDYDTGQVLLDRDKMIAFLESFFAYRALKGIKNGQDTRAASDFFGLLHESMKKDTWINQGMCMRTGWSLGDVVTETALAEISEINLDIYPLTGSDGQIVAEVRQYVAINYGCENIPLAYELIRELFTEKGQWYQTEFRLSGRWGGRSDRITCALMGYPVRTENSVGDIHDAFKMDLDVRSAFPEQVYNKIHETTLRDKDIPILQETIDVIRYPTAGIEWKFAMDIVKEFEQNGWDPESVDIETAVDTLIAELELYMWAE